jgi:imidazolonepropionase-like amidohydrolase
VEECLAAGGGWAKVIGDWGNELGEHVPSYDVASLTEMVTAVHAVGGRVAMHCQHPDTPAMALAAGADSIEHGMHLTPDDLELMAARGTAVCPTMRVIAESVATFDQRTPEQRALQAELHAAGRRHPRLVRDAFQAGVRVLAGTDGGHGLVREEVRLMVEAGVPVEQALGAASWDARAFLGLPGIEEGAPADLVVFDRDPRLDVSVLAEPQHIVLAGRVVA